MEKQEESRQLSIKALREPVPEDLLQEPVEYVFADHFRQRTLCTVLDELADAENLDAELASAALDFLKTQFAPHVKDEEEDLFPLLRERAAPEDEIETVLRQLTEEHASDQTDADVIIDLLNKVLEAGDINLIDEDSRSLIKRFAANERQHLIVENAIVLPLARARLNDEDLRELGRRMAARRGISLDI